MVVCIHRDLMGSTGHLVSDRNSFRWSETVPSDAWLFGSSDCHPLSLDLLARTVGEPLSSLQGPSHERMWEILRVQGTRGVPLVHALREGDFKAHLDKLLTQLWSLLDSQYDSYYTREFVTIRRFLQGLNQCKIDSKELYRILDDDGERDGCLRSFTPDESGTLNPVTYSQISSCSGRLTIEKGPSILTLKKSRRSLLRSRFSGGSIVQVDFVSLEPRVALSIAEQASSCDIYTMIGKSVLGGDVSRDTAKVAIIGSLYGMSPRKLSEILGNRGDYDARAILEKIKEYFKIPSLKRRLKRELKNTGSIRSHYGRIMKLDQDSDHILINRFIQSTAADAAILGFSSLMKNLSKLDIFASPVFVIHDALIVDVSDHHIDDFMNFLKKPLILPGLSGDFPVSVEIIR